MISVRHYIDAGAIGRIFCFTKRTVVLMAGTFVVHSNVMVLSNVTLQGVGPNTVIMLENAAPSLISAAGIVRLHDDSEVGAAKRVKNVTLQDFVIDGNRANQSATVDEKKFGVYSEGDYITFRRVTARNCAGYGFDPHAYSDVIPSTHMIIEDCEAFGNEKDGFTLDMVQNSVFRRNYAHDNDRHGFNLTTTATDLTISDSRALNNLGTGLTAQNGTHDVTIQSSEFSNNALEGIYLRDADGTIVSGNTAQNNKRAGISLRGTDGATVTGNTLIGNSFGSASYSEVLLDDYLTDNSSNDLIQSNVITGATARAGVMEAGLADYNQVKTNTITVTANHVILLGPHSTQSGNVLH